MCQEVEIKRRGMRSLYIGSVRDLSRHFRVIVPAVYGDGRTPRKINRMAEHCLCPVDIEESATRSGYRVVEAGVCPEYVVTKIE